MPRRGLADPAALSRRARKITGELVDQAIAARERARGTAMPHGENHRPACGFAFWN